MRINYYLMRLLPVMLILISGCDSNSALRQGVDIPIGQSEKESDKKIISEKLEYCQKIKDVVYLPVKSTAESEKGFAAAIRKENDRCLLLVGYGASFAMDAKFVDYDLSGESTENILTDEMSDFNDCEVSRKFSFVVQCEVSK